MIRSPRYEVFYEVRSITKQEDDEDPTATADECSTQANESQTHLATYDPVVTVPHIQLHHRPFLSDLIEYHANNDQGLEVLERLLSPRFRSVINQSANAPSIVPTVTPTTDQLQSFIDRSKKLRFDLRPRPSLKNVMDPTQPVLSLVAMNTRQRFTESMKWTLITICADMGLRNITAANSRKEIMNAIIATQSYVYGHDTPVITVDYLERLLKKYNQLLTVDPTLTSSIFKSKAGQGKISKVQYLSQTYPTFLHSICPWLHF